MSDYRSLELLLNELTKTTNQLSETMTDLRKWMTNDISMTAIMNERIANDMLRKAGFFTPESQSKLKQWGVHDAKTPKEVEDIIDEVIQYRKDKAAGNL